MESSERAREQRIAAEAEPEILESLGRGDDAMDVAEAIAGEYGIDEIKAYRWVVYIDEKRQKRRKRLAGITLGLTWLGVTAVLVGVIGLLFVTVTTLWVILVVVGAVVAVPSLLFALFSQRIAYRKRSF